MSKKKDDAPGEVAQFEAALGELEKIVGQLERGELKLEQSLALFERGITLARQCRRSLETAELKVKQLLGDGVENTSLPKDN
ncbi:MAG: exodeoxyribonuclease VII small subunit [Nevskiales bacterium]|nr:exodeoxyribonuclease VII small subunit [Nevskiales bacterium]